MLSACGDDGTAGGFDNNLRPIEPDLEAALGPDDDPDAIPEVQRNFLTGCVRGFGETIPDIGLIQQQGLVDVCGCSYRQLLGYSRGEARAARTDSGGSDGATDDDAFDIFVELEDDLRSGESDLPEEVLDLIRTCIRSEAGL